MKFATLHDVARAAGVSYATVDRVVNARGGVAEKSVLRVQNAIDQLGYQRDMSAANLARKRVYRFHFILPDDSNDFFRALNDALHRHSQGPNPFRVRYATTRIPAFSEAALIGALDRLDPATADCACIVALDAPAVIAAVRRARRRGVMVLTLVSDIPAAQRDHYVGIDNHVAGKTAGRMMGLAHGRQHGLVLPIIGAHRAQDHIDRLAGFREVVGKHFPHVALLDPVRSGDDATRIHDVLSKAWQSPQNPTGVYNIGAGNAGLIRWVSTIAPQDRPIMVIHELLPGSRAALERGLIDAVIDQKPQEIIKEAIRVMRLLLDGQPLSDAAPAITPAIYLPENLPPACNTSNWTPSQ